MLKLFNCIHTKFCIVISKHFLSFFPPFQKYLFTFRNLTILLFISSWNIICEIEILNSNFPGNILNCYYFISFHLFAEPILFASPKNAKRVLKWLYYYYSAAVPWKVVWTSTVIKKSLREVDISVTRRVIELRHLHKWIITSTKFINLF